MDSEKFENILWQRLDKIADKLDQVTNKVNGLDKKVYLVTTIGATLTTVIVSIALTYIRSKL